MAVRSMSDLFKGAFSLQQAVEEEIEVEEEEETPELDDWTVTSQQCVACDDHIHYTEEVFLLEIVTPVVENGESKLKPFLVEGGEYNGDFFYEPLFFEFDCWESTAESLREMVEDMAPVRHNSEMLRCDFCECSICEDEIFGCAYVGEFHVSDKQPNGEVVSKFVTIAKPYHVCIGCLILMNEHELDLWDEPLNQTGECQECTHIRCWRYDATCSCPCHAEGSEDG